MAVTNKNEFKCSFLDCFEHFSTKEKMKKHKKYSSTHEYCYVCDLDFPDWNSATVHLAENSGKDAFGKTNKQYQREKDNGDFWNNKQKYGPTYGELKFHMYYCKHCQMAFNTDSGRQRHIATIHPVEQKVLCPGCDEVFPRASGLVMHLEDGHCGKISSIEFKGYLQHKGLVNRLLRDPSLLEEITKKEFFGYLESARDESQTGGVSLIDAIDEDTIIWDEEVIMEPERPTVIPHMPVKQQKWPTLVASAADRYGVDKSSSVAAVEFAMAKLGVSNNKVTPIQSANPNTAQWPLPSDQVSTSPKPAAWAGSSTTKDLFPDAKPTPGTQQDWAALAKTAKMSERSDNILTNQFWNPASPDYDPQRFYDPIIEEYRCPMPECHAFFPTPLLCQSHITTSHSPSSISCPSCFKRFKAYHALVSHIESSGKCHVKHSSKFYQTLDEVTGGFVTAEVVARPDGTVNEDGDEVGYMKFEGCVPSDWVKKEDVVVGKKV